MKWHIELIQIAVQPQSISLTWLTTIRMILGSTMWDIRIVRIILKKILFSSCRLLPTLLLRNFLEGTNLEVYGQFMEFYGSCWNMANRSSSWVRGGRLMRSFITRGWLVSCGERTPTCPKYHCQSCFWTLNHPYEGFFSYIHFPFCLKFLILLTLKNFFFTVKAHFVQSLGFTQEYLDKNE